MGQPTAGDDADVIIWERCDTRSGVVDVIRIPQSTLWTRPMSKSDIAAKLGIDRGTLSDWIEKRQIEAEPCGPRWRVRPDIFGGRESIEQFAAAVIEPK